MLVHMSGPTKIHKTLIDPYGNGVASAPDISGDHAQRLHDREANFLLSFSRRWSCRSKVGATPSAYINTFGKSFNAGAQEQGIISDIAADARDLLFF